MAEMERMRRERERFFSDRADAGVARTIEATTETTRRFADSMETAARSVGLTSGETRLLEIRSAALDARLADAARGGGLSADALRDMDRAVRDAEASVRRFEEASRAGGLTALRDSLRDASATMSMSRDEAEVYRLTMVRTFETVGGVTVATTRRMTAAERAAAGLNDILAGIRRNARALEMNQARDSIESFTEAMQEATSNLGLSQTDIQLRRMEETLRRVGVPAGEIADRLSAARRAADEFAAAERRIADSAAAVAIRDSVLSPLERARGRLAEITRLRGAGALDAGLAGRAVGRELLGLAGGGNPAADVAPQALAFGSTAAVDAVNRARREGGGSELERIRQALERMRAEEAAQRELLARIAREAERGFFRPAGF